MTKGKKIAILIHSAGVAIAMVLLLIAVKILTGTVSQPIITVSAIFYCVAVALVTVRVVNGSDKTATAAEKFIDRK